MVSQNPVCWRLGVCLMLAGCTSSPSEPSPDGAVTTDASHCTVEDAGAPDGG